MTTPPLYIDSLYAYLARDADGNEGVCGWLRPDGMWIALVGADLDRMTSLEPIARDIAAATRSTIELVHFTTRAHIRTIGTTH